MATLQKIRDKSGLLIVVLGVALLAFVLGDFLTSGTTFFNESQNKAFVVDGDAITPQDYQTRINQMIGFQEFLGQPVDESMKARLNEFVYDTMVKEAILNKEAEKLGLTVTQEEMNDMVNGENVSPVLMQLGLFNDPQTRQFSREALIEFINYVQTDINSVPAEQRNQHMMLQSQWVVIKNMMKYGRLEQKYNALMTSALSVNDVEAKANFEDSKFRSDITYVVERYSSLPDSAVTVSNSELEKLYKERKVNFRTSTDSRKISYIVKNIQPSDADYAVAEGEVNDVYEKLKISDNPALIVADYPERPYLNVFVSESNLDKEQKDFVSTASVGEVQAPIKDNDVFRVSKLVAKTVAPDSVKIRMIAYPEGADRALATAQTDSLMSVLKGGKDFATVANEINPQANGGEVGWITEAMLANAGDELLNACFTTSKGEITKLSQRGVVQIIKVEDRTRPVTKYKVATVQVPVLISEKTQNVVDTELNQFVVDNGDAKTFVKVAQEKGYDIMPDMLISSSEFGLAQIEDSRQIIQWAFNNKVGDVKKFDIIKGKTNVRVIALIEKEIERGFAPLSEVASMLRPELIRDKKAEKMIADLKAKNITSLEGYAQAIGARVDTVKFVNFTTPSISGLGGEPVINAYSKSGQLNQLIGPVKGNSGVLMFAVQNRTEQDSEFNAEAIKQNLGRSYMYRFSPQMWLTIMKDKMNVEDNRVAFF